MRVLFHLSLAMSVPAETRAKIADVLAEAPAEVKAAILVFCKAAALAAEPAASPAAELAAEPAAEPAALPAALPAAKPAAEPAAKPSAEPAAEPAAKPSAMSTAEPVLGCGPTDLVNKVRNIVASSCSLEQREALRARLALWARKNAKAKNGKPGLLANILIGVANHTLEKLPLTQQFQCKAMTERIFIHFEGCSISDFGKLCEAMTSDAADESDAVLGGLIAGKALRLMATAASEVLSEDKLLDLAVECGKIERAIHAARAARAIHALASA